jgi:predicted DNA-binding transcriptional regulator AlpA
MARRPLRLVGTAEIRRMLGGVSKQRAYEITNRKGFPEPVADLDQGRVWLAEDVEAWITANRPPVV